MNSKKVNKVVMIEYDFKEELASVKKPGYIDRCSRVEAEFRVKETAKCKRDIIYFAEHYFRVINLDKGLHVIKLYDVQKEFLRFLVENNKVICVSGRQQGKSTIYCIYALWLATFFREKKIMILANKAATALELLGRIETAYEYLPMWLKGECVTFNKSELTFVNMSSIRAFSSSSDAARGFSANVCILDEFAFLQKNLADKLFTSMYPVISSSKNGKFIIVSTPNGVDNLYYDIWQQANSKEKDKNKEGWKPFTMYWWQVPGHDEKWKEKQIAAIGKQRFAQEFNNEFLANATSHKLIPDDLIEKYRIKLSEYRALDKDFAKGKTQFIKNEAQDKLYEFTMWHEFNPEKTYLASGDCAEGTGLDSSVLYVWDVTDLSNIIQCAKFSSTEVSPVEFAFITSKILGLYNNPFYVCERNGIGGGYLDSLRITYNYPSIAYEGKNHEAGVFSHITVKERACVWAREMMTTIGFGWTIYDRDLIEEFPTFSRKDNKGVHMVYQALPPAHDDHIMAWIWACYLLHPDKVDNYFICCKTFTSVLEKVYPLLLQPLNDYVSRDVKKVIDDPMYKDFMSFKEEVQQKLGKALLEEKTANNNDQFLKQRSMRDPYFGDFDSDWGGYSGSTSHATHTLQHAPRYFVF